MKRPFTSAGVAIAAALAVLTAGCERPPMKSQQIGYRGLGMESVVNPRTEARLADANALPERIDPVKPGGQLASKAYKNVQVLGDLTEDEFTRLMIAITAWVSPDSGGDGQGCAYCHNVANMAEDNLYTKHVARRMLQMTKHINRDWSSHVAQTGVTCYTCHRGKNVPDYIWFSDENADPGVGFAGYRAGQNAPAKSVAMSSLPYEPFTALLGGGDAIRVQATTALPTGHVKSIQEAERTYGLMMHMSSALGVNCTFCHNSRAFGSWEQSTPQRISAWHGIRMVRDLNQTYLAPLGISYPARRLGPAGDAPKAYCATCHQGANKPLNGAQMWKEFPELDATSQTAVLKPWTEPR